MRTQLTRSITLFDAARPQAQARDDSAVPADNGFTGRTNQRWTATFLCGTALAFVFCAPLFRHLH